ncbi:MAG: hypothetical protein WCV69_04670 [Patescibacteria group bacterium]|jgi:hypothetical protein
MTERFNTRDGDQYMSLLFVLSQIHYTTLEEIAATRSTFKPEKVQELFDSLDTEGQQCMTFLTKQPIEILIKLVNTEKSHGHLPSLHNIKEKLRSLYVLTEEKKYLEAADR